MRFLRIEYRTLRYLTLVAFALTTFVFAQVDKSQQPRIDLGHTSSIDLKRTLAPSTPCRTFQQRIQFVSETSLLLLSGPSGDCYRSVNEIALNVVSTDGRVLARKPWPSTDPGLVINDGRIVLVGSHGLEVYDESFNPLQSLDLPPHRFMPAMQRMDRQNAVTISMEGKDYSYAGAPLSLISQRDPSNRETSKIRFRFIDGQSIIQEGEVLNLEDDAKAKRKIASLDWVLPLCGRYMYCQAYDAGASIQVSTGRKRRLLVYSNGSKFPVTDAAGLFPYFRLQVFDIAAGTELYREEKISRTADRGAAISPDGDRLATTDGQRVVIRNLQ